MKNIEKITRDFVAEGREGMDQYEQDLLSLEKSPTAPETISSIFRVVHTVKGACGFLGFRKLEALAHRGENLLSALREGTMIANPEIINCLFLLGDSIRAILTCIEMGDPEGGNDYTRFLADMDALQSDWVGAAPGGSAMSGAARVGAIPAESPAIPAEGEGSSPAALNEAAEISSVPPLADMPLAVAPVVPAPMETAPTEAQTDVTSVLLAPAADPDPAPAPKDPPQEVRALHDQTIRVDVPLLDKIMNLVGELVLVRNQVLQHALTAGNGPMTVTFQHLSTITTELQEGVMKTRMQPIKNLWGKFPRVVRELALACGKSVRLEMEGGDTELDKTILEAIKDPLTHLLRNAVDHGIETAETRVAKGKPAEGRILVKAFHIGGKVNIEMSDDGMGIDCKKIAKKALEKGLISAGSVAAMQERELAQLIFLPGFSTAEAITNVSGRGVGMDVVKTHVEKIGGSVELVNRPGLGLTLKIKIPLTLAIIPALIVESSQRRYAIPQVNILEVVRLKGQGPGKGVEWIQDNPVYRLRGNLLPLVRLEGLFQAAEGQTSSAPESAIQENFVIVLQSDSHNFGLLIHAVQETQEIVVKPLGKHLKSVNLFAGATIMGDGKVALILDVPGLAQNVNFARDPVARDSRLLENPDKQGRNAGLGENPVPTESLLIALINGYGPIAVPLASLSRLEELPTSAIEFASGTEVAQSRGRIMPLIRLSRFLDGLSEAHSKSEHPVSEKVTVIVFGKGDLTAGFMVDKVLDMVDAKLDMHLPASRPGVRGSTLIKGKATEVIDLSTFARLALPALFGAPDRDG